MMIETIVITKSHISYAAAKLYTKEVTWALSSTK